MELAEKVRLNQQYGQMYPHTITPIPLQDQLVTAARFLLVHLEPTHSNVLEPSLGAQAEAVMKEDRILSETEICEAMYDLRYALAAIARLPRSFDRPVEIDQT